jgi:hypothetical protein
MMERCHGEAASWGVVDNESGVLCSDLRSEEERWQVLEVRDISVAVA